MTTTDIHDNYRLTKVREMGGFETVAYSATLTHKGKKIAEVQNDGRGGQTLIRFFDGPLSPAANAFRAAAKRITPAEFEPEEQFLDRLRAAAEISRKRAIAVVFDGDDFWGTGTYRTIPATNAERPSIIAQVAKVHADKNPRFWDKERADFLPANQIS